MENETPDIFEIKDEEIMEGAYTTIHSSVVMTCSEALYLELSRRWLYSFRIEGFGNVRLKSNLSTGCGSLKHYWTIEEVYNKEKFFFNELESDPETKKAWCNGDKLPEIKSKSEGEVIRGSVTYPREGSGGDIIRPRNLPSDAGFSYRWDVRANANQTVMFDVAVVFQSIENGNTEITHDWRVILTTPPSPYELSGSEMKKYGIEMKYNCYYAHNPIIIVKEGGVI